MSILQDLKKFLQANLSNENLFATDNESSRELQQQLKTLLIECFSSCLKSSGSDNVIRRKNLTTFFKTINPWVPADFWTNVATLLLSDINAAARQSLHQGGFLRNIGITNPDALLFRTILHTQLFGYDLTSAAENYPDDWNGWITLMDACFHNLIQQLNNNSQQYQLWQTLLTSILRHVSDGPKPDNALIYQFFFGIVIPFKTEPPAGSSDRYSKISLEFLLANPLTSRKPHIPALFELLILLSARLIAVTKVLSIESPADVSSSSSSSSSYISLSTGSPPSPKLFREQNSITSSSSSIVGMPRLTLREAIELDFDLVSRWQQVRASLNSYDAQLTPDAKSVVVAGKVVKPLTLTMTPSSEASQASSSIVPQSVDISTPSLFSPGGRSKQRVDDKRVGAGERERLLSIQSSDDSSDDDRSGCCFC